MENNGTLKAHSGAGPKHNKWWIAEYDSYGDFVTAYSDIKGNLILFKTYDTAKARIAKLTK